MTTPDIRPTSRLAKQRTQRATEEATIAGHAQRGIEPVPFRWRQLTGTEKQIARSLAVRRLQQLDLPLDLLSGTDLEDECSWQILAMAMRDPDEPGAAGEYPLALAANVDELRELLSTDERDELITRYLDFEERLEANPAEVPEVQLSIALQLARKPVGQSLGGLMNLGSRVLALAVIKLVADAAAASSSPPATTATQADTDTQTEE